MINSWLAGCNGRKSTDETICSEGISVLALAIVCVHFVISENLNTFNFQGLQPVTDQIRCEISSTVKLILANARKRLLENSSHGETVEQPGGQAGAAGA